MAVDRGSTVDLYGHAGDAPASKFRCPSMTRLIDPISKSSATLKFPPAFISSFNPFHSRQLP